ncbi:MAG: chorismate synthase [bacterium]|nr:chorismate synthase [bacterium]
MRAANSFGEVIRVTTFGESHGPAIGCVLDGVPPNIPISVEELQHELDRRRPGQSAVSTPRKERDQVRILSGIFEGRTTGAPICLVLMSEDQQPAAYEGLREVFRPGHADFTFWKKYGIRDHRGGGRSSGRETAGRVAAGAIARQILARRGVKIVASAIEIAGIRAETYDPRVIEQNVVRCADLVAARKMEAAILAAKASKDSVGGIIELRIDGVPPGLGDPVFGKLDARLASAILSIGATTGFEIGSGFQGARMRGSEHNDQMRDGKFLSNHAGGISGGISNGNEIVIRVAIKPTSSIERVQSTMDIHGANREIVIEGRHDPCIVPRVIPVVEAMAALVILDAWEIQDRLRPGWHVPAGSEG